MVMFEVHIRHTMCVLLCPASSPTDINVKKIEHKDIALSPQSTSCSTAFVVK